MNFKYSRSPARLVCASIWRNVAFFDLRKLVWSSKICRWVSRTNVWTLYRVCVKFVSRFEQIEKDDVKLIIVQDHFEWSNEFFSLFWGTQFWNFDDVKDLNWVLSIYYFSCSYWPQVYIHYARITKKCNFMIISSSYKASTCRKDEQKEEYHYICLNTVF